MHQNRRSGWIFHPGFKEISIVLMACQSLIILFLQYSQIKELPCSWHVTLYRVSYSLFYSKLVDCIFFQIPDNYICFVKRGRACGSGKRNIKIFSRFKMSSRFSLTWPLNQLKEASCCPVFTKCGEHGKRFSCMHWTKHTSHILFSVLRN